jgi:hypothetical protein
VSDEQRKPGGLSLRTLLIAAAASAVAAIVIPLIWRPGTVFAAAMTPVVVAIVTELLHRPVETVSSVATRKPARGAETLDEPFDEPFDPLAPPSAQELDTLPQATEGPRAVHGKRRPLTGRQWKLALATGFVAFAAVAAVFTASELVAGEAVSGGGRTTFFSSGSSSDRQRDRDEPAQQDGQRDRQQEEEPTPEPTATPEATATPAPTTSPEATPTVTPTPTPVPAEPQPTP